MILKNCLPLMKVKRKKKVKKNTAKAEKIVGFKLGTKDTKKEKDKNKNNCC